MALCDAMVGGRTRLRMRRWLDTSKEDQEINAQSAWKRGAHDTEENRASQNQSM
jgi:hypothetical protein